MSLADDLKTLANYKSEPIHRPPLTGWQPGPPPLDKPGYHICARTPKHPFDLAKFPLEIAESEWRKDALLVKGLSGNCDHWADEVDLSWIEWHFPIPDPPETATKSECNGFSMNSTKPPASSMGLSHDHHHLRPHLPRAGEFVIVY